MQKGKRTVLKVPRRFRHLTEEERVEIEVLRTQGKGMMEIAEKLGRSYSTIQREMKRNIAPGERKYKAVRARKRYEKRREAVGRTRKVLLDPLLAVYIEEKLKEGWSPALISGRLELERGEKVLSHEAIYQFIYEDRFDLVKYLSLGGRHRRKRSVPRQRRRIVIACKIPITARPKAAEERSEVGHWESDCMVGGREAGEAVVVSVDRATRFILLDNVTKKDSPSVCDARVAQLRRVPEVARKSTTYDNGRENADHELVNVLTGTVSFFCAPYHSWEKGSVENRIGLLRRWVPKGTKLEGITDGELFRIQEKINQRPMKCLGFYTPKERFDKLCA